MTQPIDVVYVEVRASGEKETAKNVKKALNDIERDVDRAADEIEKSFDDAAKDIERELTQMSKALGDTVDDQVKAWGELGDVIGYDITEAGATARYAVKQFADESERDFKRVRKEVDRTKESISGIGKGGTGNLGGGLLSTLTGLGSQVMSLGALLGPIGTGAVLIGIIALIPAVIALAGALAQLGGALLLLPAAFAAVAAIAAPLMMAFSGIGDAVSALASGDLEKINEAMKNLSPSAQAFAREINGLRKPLKDLRMSVQEGFFSQFRGDLTEMVNALLPMLNRGLTSVSGALGRLARDFIDLLGANDIIEAIGDVFESTTRIVDNLRPRIIDLFGVMFGAIEHGLPFLERAADALGDLIGRFTEWLSGSLQDGSFEEFLEGAFETFQNLWDLAGALGELLVSIFGNAGDEGNDFIQQLTAIIDKMTEWFNSMEGQQALQDILDGLVYVVNMLKILAGIVQFTVQALGWLYNATDAVVMVLTLAAVAVGAFFQALWGWLQTAWGAVQTFFSSLGEWLGGVGGWFTEAWNTISNFFSQLVAFFTALPGQIWNAIQALPGFVVGVFQQMADQTLYVIGFVLGSIVRFFIELPGRLAEAGVALWQFIVTLFTTIGGFILTVTATMIDAVVGFFAALPDRTWAALVGIIGFVASIFTSVSNAVISRVMNLVNSVVSFFSQLPNRASSAASSLPNRILAIINNLASRAVSAGRNVMEGVANGIRNGTNSAINAAINAAKRVLEGFWDALGIGSPSTVAADTVGAPIMQGVGVGVENEAPKLKDVINRSVIGAVPGGFGTNASANNHAESSIVFGEGAVQVTFEGVIPTEDEAMQTGAAVGNGISQTLARRNVRTSIRTV